MTIYELRKSGYKIRVTHYRYFPVKNSTVLLRRDLINGHNIITQNGITKIEVRLLDGREVEFSFSQEGNYDKKYGVQKCLIELDKFLQSIKNE